MSITQDLPSLARSRKIADSSGSDIGKVEWTFIDPATESHDWVAVGTGLMNRKLRLCPLTGAEEDDAIVKLAFTEDQISDAPECPDDGILTTEVEQKAYEHYGLDWNDHDPDRNYGDRTNDFGSDDAPVTYDEDSEIRDPESGDRRDAEDMVLPEHHEGIRPHPDEDAAVETTGEITPPTRGGGEDDPSADREAAAGN